jgi:hypothetical protein
MREASGFGRFSLNNLVLAVVSERREIRTYDCTRYAVRAPKGQVHVITMRISLLLTPMPHQLPTLPSLPYSHIPLSPHMKEEEYYGDGRIKEREKDLRKDRFNFMLAHKGNIDMKGLGLALIPQLVVSSVSSVRR